MGAGRVLAGLLFCIVAICLIITFVTLGFSVNSIITMGGPDTSLFQAIFLIAVHPYSFVLLLGQWSIIAALAAGAFIGGLIAKGAKSGLAVGSISFALLLFLQLAVAFFFDFTAIELWYALLTLGGGNVIIDLILASGLLIVCGAIGGALTGGGK
jgi:hypothetical protein